MSKIIETIYNTVIADEKLKAGTKYEMLAALVYKALDPSSVVIHDFRLRGDGKAASHQIDVTIENNNSRHRILIECKDYDKVVGIKILRDFYGAISQIRPNGAIVLTRKGFTKMAVKFANDEGIKLGIFREFLESDWDNRLKNITFELTLMEIQNPRILGWLVPDEDLKEIQEKLVLAPETINRIETKHAYFYDSNGEIENNFENVLTPIFNSFAYDSDGKHSGAHRFENLRHIKIGNILVPVHGFKYEFTATSSSEAIKIGLGKQIAILLLSMLDGTIDKVIFDNDIKHMTFKNGKVITQNKHTK